MIKAQNPKLPELGLVSGIQSLDFDIVLDFEFRISKFERFAKVVATKQT